MEDPAKKIIDQIFRDGLEQASSDIHLMSFKLPYLRIDGELKPLIGYEELTDKQLKALAFSMLTPIQQETFMKEREMDISYELDTGTRFRVNLSWEKGNVAIAARIISSDIPSLSELEMPQITYDLLRKPSGLVLVTGPTGSGKSTTLASMIESINRESSKHIITLEDPIEFVYESKKSLIAQRQLGVDMNSFGQGLKRILRQDPDVILVGEMRDPETISTTITLAETGHLVLATLHTFSAPQTIDRIIDSFPPHQQNQVRLQLAMTLQGVISQRLLSRVGGGRVAAREVMINTSAISNLIRESKIASMKTIIQTSAGDGMITMDQSLVRLYREGSIKKEDARVFMDDPRLLQTDYE